MRVSEQTQASGIREGRTLRIRGLVQGVGFRPTVWRLANDMGLAGNVRNDGQGVVIDAYAAPSVLDTFAKALLDNCPPLARIDEIEASVFDGQFPTNSFLIVESQKSTISTGIVPDAATCPECVHELNDPSDPRYHYPFINCTHCGPRLSIVRSIPYDRANTSMSAFEMCDRCRAEYQNPADRRFHAQPIACPQCGPRAWLCDRDGRALGTSNPIADAARLIKRGAIVAVKGIGGIHLACDAGSSECIERLRQRKHRPHKPLALMARSLEQISAYCRVNEAESAALTSPAAPIVILDALRADLLPQAIAPDHARWGFMLPYSPLHHRLMAELERPIVLTSGNRSDEPQCIDNAEALTRLVDIADAFLLHDRPIENRIDDSVTRFMGNQIRVLRRARGYAPGHLSLPAGFTDHPPLLALGGELKNTFCLLDNGHAILSQHMGDLENARTYADFRRNISLYLGLYDHAPTALVVDQHPEYLSAKLGRDWAQNEQLALLEVQHHHAHIAACMADNGIGLDDGPVIGIALDGLGFGEDGTLWGGEFLLADYRGFERLAHLKPVAMPGGAQAMREPWRNTFAHIRAVFGWEAFAQLYPELDLTGFLETKPIRILDQMIARGFNSPLASSAGRLFDAVAGAIGLAADKVSYEGQAAMALESCTEPESLVSASPYPFAIPMDTKPLVLDPKPCWESLLDDLRLGVPVTMIAARFHKGLARALVNTAKKLADDTGVQRIAMSGGVFQNRTLFELVEDGLRNESLQVFTHRQLAANDGGLCLGQAVVAAARLSKKRN